MHPVTTSSDYTVFEGGTAPGGRLSDGAALTFDLDFGRIGIQICFDAGFPETWQALADQGARIVFWPSAYNGGFPLRVYAYLHHYYVVSSVRTDKSRIIDPCGTILAQTDDLASIIYRDINSTMPSVIMTLTFPSPTGSWPPIPAASRSVPTATTPISWSSTRRHADCCAAPASLGSSHVQYHQRTVTRLSASTRAIACFPVGRSRKQAAVHQMR